MTTLVERCRPLDRAIGEKLRAARKMKGVTQQDLARRLGVTHQQIQKYEDGSNRVAASVLVMICEILEVDLLNLVPRTLSDGRAAPDPFAALGATIGGYEVARDYARLTPDQQRAIRSIIRTIISADAPRAAA